MAGSRSDVRKTAAAGQLDDKVDSLAPRLMARGFVGKASDQEAGPSIDSGFETIEVKLQPVRSSFQAPGGDPAADRRAAISGTRMVSDMRVIYAAHPVPSSCREQVRPITDSILASLAIIGPGEVVSESVATAVMREDTPNPLLSSEYKARLDEATRLAAQP